MKCFNCDIEFTPKRKTAKYCSDNCRVKSFLKKSKKERLVTETKMEVLYNSLLEMVGKINYQPATSNSYKGNNINQITHDELPMFPKKPKIRRSYENYQQLKIDCQTFEEWEELKSEIIDSDLPKDQKTLLLK